MLSRMGAGASGKGAATVYEIVVRGTVDEELVSDLGGRCFQPQPGKTVIVVDMIDQAHFHGVLAWLEQRNIDIERVNPV